MEFLNLKLGPVTYIFQIYSEGRKEPWGKADEAESWRGVGELIC